jgi:hypothetical protein
MTGINELRDEAHRRLLRQLVAEHYGINEDLFVKTPRPRITHVGKNSVTVFVVVSAVDKDGNAVASSAVEDEVGV